MLTRDLLAVTNLLVKHCQDQIKLLLTEIFEPIFFELQSTEFSKIFKERRWQDYLSFLQFVGKSVLKKNITVKFSKINFGSPRSQGVPNFKKCYGRSIGGLETYLTVKRF